MMTYSAYSGYKDTTTHFDGSIPNGQYCWISAGDDADSIPRTTIETSRLCHYYKRICLWCLAWTRYTIPAVRCRQPRRRSPERPARLRWRASRSEVVEKHWTSPAVISLSRLHTCHQLTPLYSKSILRSATQLIASTNKKEDNIIMF